MVVTVSKVPETIDAVRIVYCMVETNVPEGQEVKIGEVVATIDDSKTSAESGGSGKASAPAKSAAPASGGNQPLSPAVRRIVEEEHLDANKISGTGKGGRLTKGDVLEATRSRSGGDTAVSPEKETEALSDIAEGNYFKELQKRAAHLRNARG